MSDMTARAMSTVGIWLAVALVLAVGVFQRNWNGDAALMLLGMVVLTVCGSAAIATVAVWRHAPQNVGSSPARQAPEATPRTSDDVNR